MGRVQVESTSKIFIQFYPDSQYDTKYRFDKMGHKYAIEVDSDNIDVCCEKLTDFFRDINSKEVPPRDDSGATYVTVKNRSLETGVEEVPLGS